MPRHDPMISRNMLRRTNRLPMRRRHILNPSHPDGIVDVPKLVNVGGGWGKAFGEGEGIFLRLLDIALFAQKPVCRRFKGIEFDFLAFRTDVIHKLGFAAFGEHSIIAVICVCNGFFQKARVVT